MNPVWYPTTSPIHEGSFLRVGKISVGHVYKRKHARILITKRRSIEDDCWHLNLLLPGIIVKKNEFDTELEARAALEALVGKWFKWANS